MDSLFTFAESFPAALQWFAVMLVGAVPFVESYGGAALGVITGVPTAVAILAAVVGNVIAMTLTVWIAGAIRDRAVEKRKRNGTKQPAPGKRKQRLQSMFERFGVPGVSLLGQSLLPSHVTAPTLVGFGASRASVLVWQTVGITAWGVAFGLLAAGGVSVALR